MPKDPTTPFPWPHAPPHQLSESGTYFVTAGTYKKAHVFKDDTALTALQGGLLKYAQKYNWHLEAWVVFSNHYHFVAHSPPDDNSATSLKNFLSHFHTKSSTWLNRRDSTPGRKVWHNF